MEIDDAGEQEQEVAVAREGERGRQSEQPPETRREGKDGQAQGERQPEAAPEILHHAGVMRSVTAVVTMMRVRVRGVNMLVHRLSSLRKGCLQSIAKSAEEA